MGNGANSVDFPDPLAPTMAILESKPTSILAPRKTTFSGVYPNVTSDICNNGGDIFSVSGSLSQGSLSERLRPENPSTLTWNSRSHLLLGAEDQGAVSRGQWNACEAKENLTFSKILIFDWAWAAVQSIGIGTVDIFKGKSSHTAISIISPSINKCL